MSIISYKSDVNSLRKELDALKEIQLNFTDQPLNEEKEAEKAAA